MSTITLARTPNGVREQIRTGQWRGVTSGVAPGYVQANLAILPRIWRSTFCCFASGIPNPARCWKWSTPEVPEAVTTAPGSDLRTEIPGYRIYSDGEFTAEVDSLVDHWQDDLVSFLLGCSFSFETAMVEAGIRLRHQELGRNVAMYRTSIPTSPAGVFSGPMVVSMRPVARDKIVRAVQVTSRFPSTHGAPVHIGDPSAIGIENLSQPDYGDPVDLLPGEEPVFWACGVTPQAVALKCKPSLMITHAPGKMFITDQRDADYAVL